MNRYRVDVALSAGQTYKGITAGIVGVQVEATSEQEAINKALREVGAKFWKEIHLLEEADPDLRTYEVGLTKEGEDITVRVDAASQGLAIRDAVVQNRGWIWNKKIQRVNEAPSPTVTGEAITTVEGAHNGLKITSTGKLQQVRIPNIELAKATAEKECGMAVLSDEGKAIAAQHAEDSLNLIDLILHYRNPADDAARLRQIRIVME